jgi:hypothetical protein
MKWYEFGKAWCYTVTAMSVIDVSTDYRFWRGADSCGRRQVPFAPSSELSSNSG